MTTSNSGQDLSDVRALIESGKADEAVAELLKAAAKDKTGETQANLGVIYFQREEYEPALQQFEAALKCAPSRADWIELRDLCLANSKAEIQVQVPDHQQYEREELLRPPVVPAGTLPTPPPHLELKTSARGCVRSPVTSSAP